MKEAEKQKSKEKVHVKEYGPGIINLCFHYTDFLIFQ